MTATGVPRVPAGVAAAAEREPLELHPIEGPTALGGSLRRFAYLTSTIAITEFKLRFYGSALGYFWQLIRPLLMFGTLYLVFNHVVKIGDAVQYYPVVLLMNIVLFTYFGDGSSAVTSVVDREQLVRKIQVPRLAIPLAQTLTATFNVALNLIVVLIFAFASGIELRWTWIFAPFLLVALALIAAGFAMLLSALYVRFRDVKPMWDVFIQMMFYATPVIYVLDGLDIPEEVKNGMAMSPIAAILIQMRHVVIDPAAPTAAEAVGGGALLLIPITIGVTILVLGYWVFNREAPRIAEEL